MKFDLFTQTCPPRCPVPTVSTVLAYSPPPLAESCRVSPGLAGSRRVSPGLAGSPRISPYLATAGLIWLPLGLLRLVAFFGSMGQKGTHMDRYGETRRDPARPGETRRDPARLGEGWFTAMSMNLGPFFIGGWGYWAAVYG